MEELRLNLIKNIIKKINGDTSIIFDQHSEDIINEIIKVYPKHEDTSSRLLFEDKLFHVLKEYSFKADNSFYEKITHLMRYLIRKEIRSQNDNRCKIVTKEFTHLSPTINKYDNYFYGFSTQNSESCKNRMEDIIVSQTHIITKTSTIIFLWSLNLQLIKSFECCSTKIYTILSCKNKIISACHPHIKIWDIDTEECVTIREDCIKIKIWNDSIVGFIKDHLIVWDLDGKQVLQIYVHGIDDFIILEDGKIVTNGKNVEIWNLKTQTLDKILYNWGANKIVGYKNLLAVISYSEIKIFNTSDYTLVRSMKCILVNILHFIDEDKIVCYSDGERIKYFNRDICKKETAIKYLNSFKIFTHNQILLWDDGTIIWNIETGKIDHRLRDYSGSISCYIVKDSKIICGTTMGRIMVIE